jgi:tripeptide aminopeptidase
VIAPDAVLDRFLRYVTIDTQSSERSQSTPSTPGQVTLLRQLEAELRELGAADVELHATGHLTATVPATTDRAGIPTIGFIAHVDTSPELSGAGVRPIVHRAFDGRDVVLPDDPSAVLRVDEDPALGRYVGHDIVTASGATLLGADDKAGVAAIVAAAEYLLSHPAIAHGAVRIAFTPDEEIGRGADRFDVGRFGARCAYTVDGGSQGDLEMESFSADAVTVTFRGFNTHPGYAKGRLVNALKVASDFVARLPAGALSPETTDGYDGFVHPYIVEGGVERTAVRLLVRDFDTPGLAAKERLIEALARDAVAAHPGASLDLAVEPSYRNMKEALDRDPLVVEHAAEAIRRADLEVTMRPIRGGTDGSRLSFMGLPTPNLFAGEHAFHSRLEWTSVQEMAKAAEVVVRLCQVWSESKVATTGA